jgi:hypothetical protein
VPVRRAAEEGISLRGQEEAERSTRRQFVTAEEAHVEDLAVNSSLLGGPR